MSVVPERLGPYRIEGVLGHGGEGIVYQGLHAQTGQAAAVKTVLTPRPELLSGIRWEVHALARLRHPGIVRILEEGLEDGLPWYAMELVQSPTWRQWTRQLLESPQPEPEPTTGAQPTTGIATLSAASLTDSAVAPGTIAAASPAPEASPTTASAPQSPPLPQLSPAILRRILIVARRLCRILAYVHGEGLVHRDLKPGNVLIRPGDQPVLVDFGVAGRFAASLGREALEAGGVISGTVTYMAPEQVQGQFVDARADLYALGCILYELLANRAPFLGPNMPTVLRQHLYSPPQPLSRLRAGVPAQLEELVLRLLAKQPRDRLGHADDVAAVLARLIPDDRQDFDQSIETPRARPYLYRSGFVGRVEALGQLEVWLAAAQRGQGRILLVGGSSGVGKTRLVMELTGPARKSGVRVLLGECQPPIAGSGPVAGQSSGHKPLEALLPALRHIADLCRQSGLTETQRLLGERGKLLAPYEPALANLPGQAELPEPAELPAESARLRLFQALLETLTALCQDRPLLLVLDDLQWADELTLGCLDFLARTGALDSREILLIGTYRTDEVGSALQQFAQRVSTHLELDRLDEKGVGAMLAEMLALQQSPVQFARFLTAHSEGNPFFVAEYLRTAVAEGLLWRDLSGNWQVAQPDGGPAQESDYAALPLPSSLRDLVTRHLEGLDEPTRDLLERACILGRECDLELLQRTLPARLRKSSPAITELLRRQILEQPQPGRLRFSHDKLREVTESLLKPRRRVALHRTAALALESLPEIQRNEALALLAHHWEHAQKPQQAAGFYLAAARKAERAYALGEAERLYHAHLRLVATPTSESITARNELGEKLLLPRGDTAAALTQHQLALEEAQGLGETLLEGQSLRLLGEIHRLGGRTEEAESFFRQALELARSIRDPRFESITLANLAVLHRQTARNDEARLEYEQALELARSSGNPEAETYALGGLAILHQEQGRMELALTLNQQAIDLARQLGDRRREATLLSNRAIAYNNLGRLDEAQALHEQALERTRQIGYLQSEASTLGNLAVLHHEQGRYEVALPMYLQALQLFRHIGNRRMEGISLGNLGNLYMDRGQMQEARLSFLQALDICRQLGNRRTEGVILNNLAGLSQEEGQPEQARQLFHQALDLHRQAGNRTFEGITLRRLAELELLVSSNFQQAEEFLTQAQGHLTAVQSKAELSKVFGLRGHIALARGQEAEPFAQQAQPLVQTDQNARIDMDRLQRAIQASRSGDAARTRLFHGLLLEDISLPLRRWLVEAGHLPPSSVP